MTDNEAGLVDGERGRRIRARDRRLMRPFIGAHRRIIQASSGRVLARMGGHPLLVLTTTGRRSGKPHSTPVSPAAGRSHGLDPKVDLDHCDLHEAE